MTKLQVLLGKYTSRHLMMRFGYQGLDYHYMPVCWLICKPGNSLFTIKTGCTAVRVSGYARLLSNTAMESILWRLTNV